jgi:hypothetical protein
MAIFFYSLINFSLKYFCCIDIYLLVALFNTPLSPDPSRPAGREGSLNSLQGLPSKSSNGTGISSLVTVFLALA